MPEQTESSKRSEPQGEPVIEQKIGAMPTRPENPFTGAILRAVRERLGTPAPAEPASDL